MLEVFRKMHNNSRELYVTPQRAVRKAEILLYFALPAMLILTGFFPLVGIAVLPAVLALLYLLYRRFGLYLPLCCVLFYGILSLALDYDIISVIYFVALFFGFIGIVFSCQISPYLACAAAAAGFAIVGAFIGVGIVRLAENKPICDIAAEYVVNGDGIVRFFAYDYYDAAELAPNEDKLLRGDDGYHEAATLAFSDWAKDEFTYYIWYYCIHYGALCAAVAFFIANAVNRRTTSASDSQAEKAELNKSTRSLGGVRKPITAIADMKMPRAYLWTCVLPAALAAIVLEFVGGYDFISATVMHLFVTLPSAFTCYALFAYFAAQFSGKAKVAATVIVVIIGLAAVVFPFVVFVLSILGVCDCILNIRYWVKFIREE